MTDESGLDEVVTLTALLYTRVPQCTAKQLGSLLYVGRIPYKLSFITKTILRIVGFRCVAYKVSRDSVKLSNLQEHLNANKDNSDSVDSSPPKLH